MSRATKVHVMEFPLGNTGWSNFEQRTIVQWDWRTEHLEWALHAICGTGAERHMLTLEPVFWDVPAAVRCRRCEYLLALREASARHDAAGHELGRMLQVEAAAYVDRRRTRDAARELERATTVECALVAIARYVASSGFRFEPLVDHPRPSDGNARNRWGRAIDRAMGWSRDFLAGDGHELEPYPAPIGSGRVRSNWPATRRYPTDT